MSQRLTISYRARRTLPFLPCRLPPIPPARLQRLILARRPPAPAGAHEPTGLGAPPTTQAVDSSAPATVAAVDDPNAADGGPRKVKTMGVRPDRSVLAPRGR